MKPPFREPDEAGWQPQQEPIDINPGCTLDTCLHTRLELPHIVGEHAMLPERLFASPFLLQSGSLPASTTQACAVLVVFHIQLRYCESCKHAAWWKLSANIVWTMFDHTHHVHRGCHRPVLLCFALNFAVSSGTGLSLPSATRELLPDTPVCWACSSYLCRFCRQATRFGTQCCNLAQRRKVLVQLHLFQIAAAVQ